MAEMISNAQKHSCSFITCQLHAGTAPGALEFQVCKNPSPLLRAEAPHVNEIGYTGGGVLDTGICTSTLGLGTAAVSFRISTEVRPTVSVAITVSIICNLPGLRKVKHHTAYACGDTLSGLCSCRYVSWHSMSCHSGRSKNISSVIAELVCPCVSAW